MHRPEAQGPVDDGRDHHHVDHNCRDVVHHTLKELAPRQRRTIDEVQGENQLAVKTTVRMVSIIV